MAATFKTEQLAAAMGKLIDGTWEVKFREINRPIERKGKQVGVVTGTFYEIAEGGVVVSHGYDNFPRVLELAVEKVWPRVVP
jgi:hypothetical protein